MITQTNWKRWCFFIPLLMVPAGASTSADISPELLKATYIMNIQRFIKMGKPPHKPQAFCYYERQGVSLEESVGQEIEKYVKEHPAPEMMTVKKFTAIRELSGCDIFYIPAEEEDNIDNILTALDASSTLTISSAQRFIARGGMIGFIEDEGRIKMEANQKNAIAKNVSIDAQLLEIMRRVISQ